MVMVMATLRLQNWLYIMCTFFVPSFIEHQILEPVDPCNPVVTRFQVEEKTNNLVNAQGIRNVLMNVLITEWY